MTLTSAWSTLVKHLYNLKSYSQTRFKLESLPEAFLTETLFYIEPEELLELQFLNKNLFRLVRYVIKQHLKVSAYISNADFRRVQKDFIKENNQQIKHLMIKDWFLSLYFDFYCDPVTIDLHIKSSMFDSTNNFANVTKLDLCIDKGYGRTPFNNVLEKIKWVLYKLESFHLETGFSIVIDEFLLLLNPNKLKSLIIWNEGETLKLKDVLKFKQFKMLERLIFSARNYEFSPFSSNELDPIIFTSLKEIGILLPFISGTFNYKILGQLNTLNKVYVTNYNKVYVTNHNSYDEMLEFINKNNSKNLHLDCDFRRGLRREIHEMPGLLAPILEFQKFTTLEFSSLNDACNFSKTQKLSIKDTLIEHTFNYDKIEKIIFKFSKIYIQSIFHLLKYFPNVKAIYFKQGCLLSNGNQLCLPASIHKGFILSLDRNSVKGKFNQIQSLCKKFHLYIF